MMKTNKQKKNLYFQFYFFTYNKLSRDTIGSLIGSKAGLEVINY